MPRVPRHPIEGPNGTPYQIGFTNLTDWRRYPSASDQDRITILRERPCELGAHAAAQRKEVLRKNERFRYADLPVPVSVGVSEIFRCNVLGLENSDPVGPP